MKISTSGRYAVRAMLDLAIHGTGSPISRQEIATRQQISSEYMAQLFRPLCKDRLVTSVMGPGGGYILKRPAASIRVGDIIRSAEGPIAIVNCVLPGSDFPCERIAACPTHVIWAKLNGIIEEYLDSISLKDLITIAQEVDPLNSKICPDPIDTIFDSLKISGDQPACLQ